MSSLKTSRRWQVAPSNQPLEDALATELGIAPLVARIMVAHGITSPEEGRRFLTPSLQRDWADPLIIPGLSSAADRVEHAVRAGERITVFGDFDVDGITSTCLLTEALRTLGAQVTPFIPHRFDEGYGLSTAALERLVADDVPDLVITVDNGIASRNEVPYLLEQGIDVVVTDHHEPADLVPEGIPVADPKIADDSPSRELAGAGVALKLVQVLGKRLGQPGLWRSLTEVAALGTVSDMMTLTAENRALVADGIAQMRRTSRPGYVALAAVTGTDLATVSADTLSFSLIPRLNAAGRMADPAIALDLLLARDPAEAARLASELEAINQERRSIEAELTDEAMALAERSYAGGRVVLVGGAGWHEGVKGIVASRLVNRYHVPALLFSLSDDGVAHGSGRSVGSVNLFDAVEKCSDLLIRFGGHAGAVGVTCEASKLDELRDRLEEVLETVPAEDFEDRGEIAGIVDLGELDISTVESMAVLEPYGQGNKVPLLAATGVVMTDRARVGKTGDHMRFTATDGRSGVPAIMFRVPDIDDLVDYDGAVDLVFEAVAERWQGRVKTKLMVKDILRRDDPATGGTLGGGFVDRLFSEADAAAQMGVPDPEPVSADERGELSVLDVRELEARVTRLFIGDGRLHDSQARALELLDAGKNVLCVMGTGRGKSLIFQIHAVVEALARGKASVFVFPLRALVADQAFHMRDAFARLGLSSVVLTGEALPEERERAYAGVASGDVDVVLTTPEFFALHADRFAQTRRVGFVVVDEAHHAGLAKGGHRSAYGSMPRALEAMGNPRVLAVTATADSAVAREISNLLGIDTVVVDETSRPNLLMVDERELANRENRLVSIVASGEKCVVYVNSREQSVALARMLRRRVPELGARVAFYHAGLDRASRGAVERAFRGGPLSCVVSTSAFGEGVNLPDIRHVVLYHMPFGSIEFNQMSGRAGRDGRPAQVHLMYSTRDARINERILNASAPTRPELVTLYRALQTMWRSHRRETGETSFAASNLDIAKMCLAIDARAPIVEAAVPSGISIFTELGFMRTEGFGTDRRIEMVERPGRVELEESIRYLEGIRARREFDAFKDWALRAAASEMLARINRPIAPR